MARAQMTNMHLPLPERIYLRLRAEARRVGRPATDIAREAIDSWLTEQQRIHVHEAVAEYAANASGSTADLDADLEAAGIEHLVAELERGGQMR